MIDYLHHKHLSFTKDDTTGRGAVENAISSPRILKSVNYFKVSRKFPESDPRPVSTLTCIFIEVNWDKILIMNGSYVTNTSSLEMRWITWLMY